MVFLEGQLLDAPGLMRLIAQAVKCFNHNRRMGGCWSLSFHIQKVCLALPLQLPLQNLAGDAGVGFAFGELHRPALEENQRNSNSATTGKWSDATDVGTQVLSGNRETVLETQM